MQGGGSAQKDNNVTVMWRQYSNALCSFDMIVWKFDRIFCNPWWCEPTCLENTTMNDLPGGTKCSQQPNTLTQTSRTRMPNEKQPGDYLLWDRPCQIYRTCVVIRTAAARTISVIETVFQAGSISPSTVKASCEHENLYTLRDSASPKIVVSSQWCWVVDDEASTTVGETVRTFPTHTRTRTRSQHQTNNTRTTYQIGWRITSCI